MNANFSLHHSHRKLKFLHTGMGKLFHSRSISNLGKVSGNNLKLVTEELLLAAFKTT